MKSVNSKQVLYGTDLFFPSKRRQAVEFAGFLNNDDAQTLAIVDFYYSSFQYGKYNYLLYEKDAESEFPIASMFAADISLLPFLQSSAKFENKPYINQSDKKETISHTINSDEEAIVEEGDKINLFNKYQGAAKVEFSPLFVKVYASYTEQQINVFLNCENTRLISDVLSSFFAQSEPQVKVSRDKDMALVGEKYYVSLARACIIAAKASMKFKTDIIYKFSPFLITGELNIDEKIVLKKSDTSLVNSQISISYDMGNSDLFSDKIADEMLKNASSLFPPHHRNINIAFTHSGHYNSNINYKTCSSIVLSFCAKSLIKTASAFGLSLHYFLDHIISHYSKDYVPSDESMEAKTKLFECSNYILKSSIYTHNSSSALHLSTLFRESKKRIALVPVFLDKNLYLAIIEYNDSLNEILNIYMTLPKIKDDENRYEIFSFISSFMTKLGYSFSHDFSQKNITLLDFDTKAECESLYICSVLLEGFRIGYVDV